MRNVTFLAWLVLSLWAMNGRNALAGTPSSIKLPLTFEPNLGQTDASVRYLTRGGKSAMWLTDQGPVIAVGEGKSRAVIRMRFAGGNRSPKVEAEDPKPGVTNYLWGSDSSKWHTGVPQYGKVRYRSVYPGVDVVFYGNPDHIEYDFVLAPGADPSRVRIQFDGAKSVSLDSSGDLMVKAGDVEIRHRRPSIYQHNRPVEGGYAILGKRSAGFRLRDYDKTEPLIIDPVMIYGTLLGGTNGDQANGVAVDSQGMVYLVGETSSPNFPIKSAIFPTGANPALFSDPPSSGFLVKINPKAAGGASLIYSTLIPGPSLSSLSSVAVDSSGSPIIVGTTSSSPADGFPLMNAYYPSFLDNGNCVAISGSNATIHCPIPFVMKLNSTGSAVVYSSYIGGSGNSVNGVTLDSAGNAYIGVTATSSDIPIRGNGAVQPYQNGLRQVSNAYFGMISPQGNLVYSTFFGGGQDTVLSGIAVDSNGLIYVAGNTSYNQLPTTPGAFQPKPVGKTSGYVAVFNLSPNANSELQYCTYLGAPQGAQGGANAGVNGVAVDKSGRVYVAGVTDSANFPTTSNAFLPAHPGGNGTLGYSAYPLYNAFVSELDPSQQGSAQLLYSTYWGGSGDEVVNAIAVDSAGRITVAGITDSQDLPYTLDAFQCCYAGYQNTPVGFLLRLDPTKSGAASVVYASLLQGQFTTDLVALAEDSGGNTVAVAGTVTAGAPVSLSAYQSGFGGQLLNRQSWDIGDAYLAVFDMTTEGPIGTTLLNSGGLHQILPAFLSPGLLFTIEGLNLGPSTAASLQLDSNGLVSKNLQGVQVLVNGTPAPVIYVSSTVVNAIAPYSLASQAGQVANVQIVYNGVAGTIVPILIAATAPGILNYDDGSGQAIVGNQDGSPNGASNPAAIGSTIVIYATGEGQTTPPGVDGLPANNFNALPKPNAAVSLTIGGVPVPAANILYAGAAPTAVAGVLQINATIPSGVIPGNAVPIVLTIGGVSSQKTATIAVKAQ